MYLSLLEESPFSVFASVTCEAVQRIACRRPSEARAILRPGRKQTTENRFTQSDDKYLIFGVILHFPVFASVQKTPKTSKKRLKFLGVLGVLGVFLGVFLGVLSGTL